MNKHDLPNVDNYKLFPALAAYIDRVAAEQGAKVDQRNHRRIALVRQEGKYKRDQTNIIFAADGTVTAPKALMPTDEEAKNLKAEFAGRKFPRSIPASESHAYQQRTRLGVSRDYWFEIRDRRNRSTIIMCRQRIDKEDGGKIYIPWTYFSDGEWRSMEPDADRLPLWKPAETRNKCRIMIHEGEKVARFVDGLVNDPKHKTELAAHPWAADLADYEHWGWIGGAPH